MFGKDVGGSEFWQLYWYDLDQREATLLTDGKRSRNENPVWSRDGRQLAYSSTARNGTDTDVWVRDMASGQSRAVVTAGGAWYASDFSPDGKRLLVSRRVSINEIHPGVVDLVSGKLREFPVDGGKAAFNAFLFGPDGRQVYYVSDEESEFLTLRHHDPAGGAPKRLGGAIPWDVQDLRIAPDGKTWFLSKRRNRQVQCYRCRIIARCHCRTALGDMGSISQRRCAASVAVNSDITERRLRLDLAQRALTR